MKKILSLLLAVMMLVCVLSACGSVEITADGSSQAENGTEKEEEFYELVLETQELLDTVADDIYSYWYDCIYNDKYLEDITYAVACAMDDNEENLATIEENTEKIKSLYKEVKDGKLGAEAKAVMQAYNDYYALVVDVSGSFESYKSNKESYKKELASALSDMSFELD